MAGLGIGSDILVWELVEEGSDMWADFRADFPSEWLAPFC
jgi:hypothetical protein